MIGTRIGKRMLDLVCCALIQHLLDIKHPVSQNRDYAPLQEPFGAFCFDSRAAAYTECQRYLLALNALRMRL